MPDRVLISFGWIVLALPMLALPIALADGADTSQETAAPAIAPVPDDLRIRLDELHWPVTELRDGKLCLLWKKGDDTEKFPAALGRVEATEIVWKHTFYPITSMTVLATSKSVLGTDAASAVRIDFALGTLELRVHGQHPAQSEGAFTPGDGTPVQRFRTGGNWGQGMDMIEDAASAPPPVKKP